MSEQPPLTARVNTLKLTRDELMARLAVKGLPPPRADTRPSPSNSNLRGRWSSFRVSGKGSSPSRTNLHNWPYCSSPQPGERVLDLCAAPGGKATPSPNSWRTAVQSPPVTSLTPSCDVWRKRLSGSASPSSPPGAATPSPPPGFREGFDRVLVDAPCSGLGVIRRNPEGKWRKGPEDIARLAGTQKKILAAAAGCTAPGGVLLYATCSTSATENEAIVDDFLSRRPDFVLENGLTLFPGRGESSTARGCSGAGRTGTAAWTDSSRHD